MKYSVTFLEPYYEQLLSAVFSKPDVEGAAYLLCGRSQSVDEERLLVREVIPVKDEHYLERTSVRLSICSDSYVPVAKRARELKSSILFVHSHPEGITDFSPQDDEEEPHLMEFFQKRVPDGTHGALIAVAGSPLLIGRISKGLNKEIIHRVRVIGRRFRFFDSVEENDDDIPYFFDRQVLAFGADIQKILRRLHIGIVGVGGTGSAVLQQLTRLGVGTISIFDHDIFDPTNVNRVYGSCISDAGRSKVDIAADSVNAMGLGTIIKKFPYGISVEQSAKALRHCDVVFGCTDKEAPRGILTQLSIRYLIPFIDMGVVIESTGGMIQGIYGRVTTAFPGEACLFCRGRINAETIRLEGLSDTERASLAAEGYAPELATNAPAVIMFTTAVATQAICEFLHRLTGFMGKERQTSEILFHFHETVVRRNRAEPNPTCVCAQTKYWGRGDSRTFLDLAWPSPK